ncbi:PREDICTED: uncharacterized protein LOC109475558 [Branchiostoma belcheri]|uniref:Uncharacterized protein LOC109475558 n=1 Tax=Branchiostoma belcheri TaxID=7741 RepID=A0A6P4Z5A7_BRABE|nr:PREDICTED: uncharacterized protein LOC109475558 [Branchiostoma belcheri]
MLPLLILAVLGLVGAAPMPDDIEYPQCGIGNGMCMHRSDCGDSTVKTFCGNGLVCCILSKSSGLGPQELDFINRDPNNINEIDGDANLDDALAEPEGTHKK